MDGQLNILSSPSITTLDNQMAYTENGERVPYVATSTSSGVVTQEVKFEDAVLRLEITPHVIDGKHLKMKIKVKKDQVDPTRTVQGNPYIIKKQTETNLIVQDGETIVISGLTKQQVSKSDAGLPGLKDIPGLGYLFKTDSRSEDMEEVLIFITPHVLKAQAANQAAPAAGCTCHARRGAGTPERGAPRHESGQIKMRYFTTLNLDREPFSNSPEPEFFFEAPQHVNCLQQLEISIRLRRGLNVVIGDVGTGKTTLSRMLIRKLHGDDAVEFHLLMEPDFSGPIQFLAGIARMMGAVDSAPGLTEWQLKEAIKQVLFRRGIDENKIVVLIIDEGQKLPGFCIEILREFLNFETNHFKLLQIVIFAQPEFNATLERRENFADRMNVCLRLKPLDFSQMRQMIEHRIEMASQIGREPVQFTSPALAAIYLATGGVPRKVVMLCHQVILAMIIRNRSRAGWFLVQSCLRNRACESPQAPQHPLGNGCRAGCGSPGRS